MNRQHGGHITITAWLPILSCLAVCYSNSAISDETRNVSEQSAKFEFVNWHEHGNGSLNAHFRDKDGNIHDAPISLKRSLNQNFSQATNSIRAWNQALRLASQNPLDDLKRFELQKAYKKMQEQVQKVEEPFRTGIIRSSDELKAKQVLSLRVDPNAVNRSPSASAFATSSGSRAFSGTFKFESKVESRNTVPLNLVVTTSSEGKAKNDRALLSTTAKGTLSKERGTKAPGELIPSQAPTASSGNGDLRADGAREQSTLIEVIDLDAVNSPIEQSKPQIETLSSATGASNEILETVAMPSEVAGVSGPTESDSSEQTPKPKFYIQSAERTNPPLRAVVGQRLGQDRVTSFFPSSYPLIESPMAKIKNSETPLFRKVFWGSPWLILSVIAFWLFKKFFHLLIENPQSRNYPKSWLVVDGQSPYLREVIPDATRNLKMKDPAYYYAYFDPQSVTWQLVKSDILGKDFKKVGELKSGSVVRASLLQGKDGFRRFRLEADGQWKSTQDLEQYLVSIKSNQEGQHEKQEWHEDSH